MIFFPSRAQVGIGTSTPDASSQLEITSTGKGLLIPRMTATQRMGITNPATGLLVYQTDGSAGFYYNGGTPGAPGWTRLSTAGSSGATLDLAATKTSAQLLSTGGTSVTPDDVSFNNILTSPSLSGASFNGTSYTVGPAGTYMVTVFAVNSGSSVTIFPQLVVNGTSILYGTGGGGTNLPTGAQSRGYLSSVLSLSAGDIVKVKIANNSTVATQSLSTDGSTRLTIVKL